MSQYVRGPILAIFGVIIALVILVTAIVLLANSGGPAGGSSIQLVSTSNNLNSLIPFLAAIISGGIALGAIAGKRG